MTLLPPALKPQIRPIDNWRLVLKHAWSVRFNIIAAMLTAGSVALPLIAPAIPVGYLVIYGAVTFLVITASLLSRFVVQDKVTPQ